MTPNTINHLIAESLGWTEFAGYGEDHLNGRAPNETLRRYVPHYYGDVDAVRAATVSKLNNSKDGDAYGRHLAMTVLGYNGTDHRFIALNYWRLMAVSNASAPQRCEAYLRTLNLWKE